MRLISHGYLCRRRHKVAMIAELNLKIQLAIPPTQSVCGMEINMINLIRRIMAVSGKYKWRIKAAFVFSFLKSLLA